MLRSSCTICTDLLTCDNLAACPCGHVYHNNCLETWYQRSRTCPTCRKTCPTSIKLFFNDSQETASQEDIHAIKNELRKQAALNLEKDAQIRVFKKEMNEKASIIKEQNSRVMQLEQSAENERAIQLSFKKQVEFLTEKTKHLEKLEKKVVFLKTNLERLERFETMLKGTHEEVEDMLKNIGSGSKTVNELSSQLIIMKKENEKMRGAKKNASAEKARLERDYNSLNHKLKTKELECGKLEKEIETLQDQLKETELEKQNLKKKVDKMQQSFDSASPRGTLINRLLQESPAPLKLDETILLSSDTDENIEFIDVGTEKQRSRLNKSKPDFVSPIHPGALQKNRKRSYISIDNPGRLSTGYNGLGGHSTVLMPSQAKKIKKVAKPRTVSKFVRTNNNPPLPHM